MLISLYKLVRNSDLPGQFFQRRRARRELLGLNDRLLTDAGISRDLLNQGLKAWPWRLEGETTPRQVPTASILAFPDRHRFISETYDQEAVRDRVAA